VEAVGWVAFFWLTFLAALPGLWLLWALRGYFGAQAAQSLTLALEDRSTANGPMRP